MAKPIRHGKTNTREYRAWASMKSRCSNEADPHYPDYGGRGVRVCQRWLHDFPAFLADLGSCGDGLSLDREDNDGDYAPDNCRWATKSEQANNRRSCVNLTHDGQTKTLAEWADGARINRITLRRRLLSGMPMERALFCGDFGKGQTQETRARAAAGARAAHAARGEVAA